MIDVQFVATGRVTLRGYCLANNYPSALTRYSDGWEVRLEFQPCKSIPPLVRQHLEVADVMPALAEMLENWHVIEEVNTGEIARYVADQERRVRESADRMHREMQRG